MLEYQVIVNGDRLNVSLDTTNPNERAQLTYQGSKEAISSFRPWLSRRTGAFGHLLKEATTPIDLHYVMNSSTAVKYSPVLVNGNDIVQKYDPQIQANEVT